MLVALKLIFAAAILAVIVLMGGIWLFQTYWVYGFDKDLSEPKAFDLPHVKVLRFTSEDGEEAQAWYAPPAPDRPVIFFLYGNYSAIGPSMARLKPLMDDGYGIVTLQYRGAGTSPGRPSEAAFARDARALWDQLDALTGQTIPADRRVLHGFSLGVGVGSRLAVERPFVAVIFESAIPRGCDYYSDRYFGLPFCRLMWSERYDIIDRVPAIDAPILFVHGVEDTVTPPALGRQVFEAAQGPKEFVELAGGHHADLASHGLIPAIRAFLMRTVP